MKVGDLFQIKDHTKISNEQLDTIFNNFCFEIVEVEEYKVVFVARERIENGSRYTLSQNSYTFEEFLKDAPKAQPYLGLIHANKETKLEKEDVKKFYLKTLPQLGWSISHHVENSIKFKRDKEDLEIELLMAEAREFIQALRETGIAVSQTNEKRIVSGVWFDDDCKAFYVSTKEAQ